MELLVKIHSYSLLLLLKHHLEAEEIPFFIRNEQVQSLFGTGFSGGINPAMGAFEIYVPKEILEDARKVLEDFFREEELAFSECPACKHPLNNSLTEICPNCGLFLR